MSKLNIKNYKKVGILGGTFDPPHKGHLYIAKTALKKIKLNKIIWVVAERNPLKQKPYLSVKERIKLSKKITKKERKIFVNFFDYKFKQKNTFNLITYIKKNNKKSKLYFLIGADSLIKFHKWKNWKKIPKLAKLIIFARKGYTNDALNSVALKKLDRTDWFYINSKKINISSSLIRKFW